MTRRSKLDTLGKVLIEPEGGQSDRPLVVYEFIVNQRARFELSMAFQDMTNLGKGKTPSRFNLSATKEQLISLNSLNFRRTGFDKWRVEENECHDLTFHLQSISHHSSGTSLKLPSCKTPHPLATHI